VPYMPGPGPREIENTNLNSSNDQTIQVEPAGKSNLQEMSEFEAANPQEQVQEVQPYMAGPEPREIEINNPVYPDSPDSNGIFSAPPIVDNFLGLDDNNTSIPPDTMGAVGPNHMVVMLNTEVRMMDKTGTQIGSDVSLDNFWTSGTGLSGNPFDPKIVYDSLSDRWMATVDADSRSASSAVWFAISDSEDPTGDWSFYAFDADSTDTYWADYPGFGMNSTWIAITNNMFTIAGPPYSFNGVKMWVIDKATALTGGTLTITVFDEGFDIAGGFDGFTLKPALTFDPAESVLYVIDNSGVNAGGNYLLRISQITGSGASPSWSVVSGSIYSGTGFFFASNNFNFTQIDAAQLGTGTLVNTNDPRILNAIFRNGRLWTTHSAGLPTTGSSNRTAAFWYEINPGAMPTPIVQSGVVENGVGTHYFFPSIAVNTDNDVALGFSYSDATQYVEAAYTGRESTDTAGTMGNIYTCKAGEDSYIKDFGSGRVRWGDYSATVVDPVDDLTFWTLQEYAETDVGGAASNDRWGTWWCRAQIGNFWQGDDSTDPTLWNVAENWSSGVVPTCGTDAVIPAVPSGGNFPVVNVDANVRNLTIASGASLTMGGNILTVCGNFDNSGTFSPTGGTVNFNGNTTQNLTANVATSFFDLTISSGTTLIETATDDNVTINNTFANNGTVRKSKTDFGTGNTTFGITGASINVSTLGNLSSLQVDRIGSAHPNEDQNGGGADMLDTYYSLTPDATDQSFSLDLCLAYTDAELGAAPAVSDEGNLRTCRWTGSAWTCQDRGTGSSTGNNTVCANGVDTFSDWTIGEVGPTAIEVREISAQSNAGFLWILAITGVVLVSIIGILQKRKSNQR